MKSKTLVRVLSILATFNAIAFVLVIFGAGACGRGDGCLLFSVLLLFTFGFGLLVLVLSGVAWNITRKCEVIPKYFVIANLTLLLLTVTTLGIGISYMR